MATDEKQTVGRTIVLGAAWGVGFGSVIGLGKILWSAITKKSDDDDVDSLDESNDRYDGDE